MATRTISYALTIGVATHSTLYYVRYLPDPLFLRSHRGLTYSAGLLLFAVMVDLSFMENSVNSALLITFAMNCQLHTILVRMA